METLSGSLSIPQRVFLIRHGQSTANLGTTVGGPESPLTDKGREEARAAGEALKGHNLVSPILVVSPFTRTRQTAHHIMQAIGKDSPDYIEPAIQERDFGPIWTGNDASKMQHEPDYFIPHPHSTRKRQMRILNPEWRPHGGESLSDVKKRASDSVNSLLEKHPYSDIVLVSHGHTIRALTAHFDGNWHSGRHVKNGEIKVFHINRWGESFNGEYFSFGSTLSESKKLKVYKELAALLRKKEHSHWRAKKGKKHIRLTSPYADRYVTVAGTPSSTSTKRIEKKLRELVAAARKARETLQTSPADNLILSKLSKKDNNV